ncbi:MAG TPA: hypothetical protein VJH37_01840 [Candidatus Nanoarchaeia archaeon]|nr:hypothetical protein [Candidatus Nanoarchaeia archaeon]
MNQIHLNELPDRLSLYRDGLNKELQDRVEAILASHGFSLVAKGLALDGHGDEERIYRTKRDFNQIILGIYSPDGSFGLNVPMVCSDDTGCMDALLLFYATSIKTYETIAKKLTGNKLLSIKRLFRDELILP